MKKSTTIYIPSKKTHDLLASMLAKPTKKGAKK